MLGIVLAAGGGVRLRPLTDRLPKTLLTVDGDRSICELALDNLEAVGIEEVVIVTGHAAAAIEERVPDWERTHDLRLRLVFNERYADWNNAYSLWLAREAFRRGALLVNGDTVHPVAVEQRLLEARGAAPIVLALDDRKTLAHEEMKVRLDDTGRMAVINKALEPDQAHGEYIGVSLIEAAAADRLADALATTFRRDPSLYYEDGYQQYADWGGEIRTAAIGLQDWVEVDDHADLARARELSCRC